MAQGNRTMAMACLMAGMALGCGDGGDGDAAEGTLPGAGDPQGDEEVSLGGLGPGDCTAVTNAIAEYVEGQNEQGCVQVCEPGWADCDGHRSNGCETSTSDLALCGRCIDACLSDLCGAEPVCAPYAADLWTVQGPFPRARVRSLAVAPSGNVFVRLNQVLLDTGSEPLAPVGAGSVLGLSADGAMWQSQPGDEQTHLIGEGSDDVKTLATPVGIYVAERFRTATVAGETYTVEAADPDESDPVGVMLSLVSFEGEHLWSRSLGWSGEGDVTGLHADEDSNVMVEVFVTEDSEFEGRTLDSSNRWWTFAFDASGEFRWVEPVRSLATRSVTAGAIWSVFDPPRSVATGEVVESVFAPLDLLGAEVIDRDADGNFIVAGEVLSSFVEDRGGLPGLSDITPISGNSRGNNNVIFVAKYSAGGELLWQTGFSHWIGSTLMDLRQGPDGTIYALVAGGVRSGGLASSLAPEPVYVARISRDGQQQGAFLVELQNATRLGLAVGEDGVVHLGANFEGTARLQDTLQGNGVVGGNIRFESY